VKSALKKALIFILVAAIVVLVAGLSAQIAVVERASGLQAVASNTAGPGGGDLYQVNFPAAISLLLIALVILTILLLLRSGVLKVKNKMK